MSMRITTTRTRYFAPSVTPFVESVSLDDFDLDEIREYLRHKGDMVAGTSDDDASDGATAGGLFISPEDLNRVETLALCGQLDSARRFVLDMVSEQIGRPL